MGISDAIFHCCGWPGYPIMRVIIKSLYLGEITKWGYLALAMACTL